MERIRLSKSEKRLLRLFASKTNVKGVDLSAEDEMAIATLMEKGLISAIVFAGKITSGNILPKGDAYVRQNPELKNPIPWEKIFGFASIVAAIAATLALFVGCVRLIAAL